MDKISVVLSMPDSLLFSSCGCALMMSTLRQYTVSIVKRTSGRGVKTSKKYADVINAQPLKSKLILNIIHHSMIRYFSIFLLANWSSELEKGVRGNSRYFSTI